MKAKVKPAASERKERPIIFSSPLIQPLLDGTKTQTRRLVNSARHPNGQMLCPRDVAASVYVGEDWVKCPYGQAGDFLWVREEWKIGAWHDDAGKFAIDYRASPKLVNTPWVYPENHEFEQYRTRLLLELEDLGSSHHWPAGQSPCRWKPAMYLPRWASRLLLRIKSVRIEPLRAITEADARAEGLTAEPCDHARRTCEEVGCCGSTARGEFSYLWKLLYPDQEPGTDHYWKTWAANPWVWVVEFRRVQP